MSNAFTPVEVFCSCAPKDETFLWNLDCHLAVLVRQGLISFRHRYLVSAGTDWAQDINTHLETASLILLLVSPDYLASSDCYAEMQQAMQRKETNRARVIPIIVRHCDHQAYFVKLQILPSNGKPVKEWRDKDAAWLDVTGGIRRAIDDLLKQESFVGHDISFASWDEIAVAVTHEFTTITNVDLTLLEVGEHDTDNYTQIEFMMQFPPNNIPKQNPASANLLRIIGALTTFAVAEKGKQRNSVYSVKYDRILFPDAIVFIVKVNWTSYVGEDQVTFWNFGPRKRLL